MGFGTPPTPPLEGDYSSWAFKWKQSRHIDEYAYNHPVRFDEDLDKIFIMNQYNYTLTERKLSDGSTPSVTSIINRSYHSGESEVWSILRKYFAYVVDEDDVPKVKIYKDGSLIQTIDLSQAPVSWTNVAAEYFVNFSPDGKYLFVENTKAAVAEYALLEGS